MNKHNEYSGKGPIRYKETYDTMTRRDQIKNQINKQT